MKTACFVVQNHYDADPRVRRKAEALVAAGYSVDVLSLRDSHDQKKYVLNGVNVRTVSVGKRRGSLSRYAFEYAIFFLWVFFRAPVQMLQRRYAMIDVNSLPDFLAFAPVLAKWMGARVVLDLHELAPEFYMSKYRAPADARPIRLLRFLERISGRFADHVITINEPAADLFASRGLPRPKITVIMNAVDEERFRASAAASSTAGRPGSGKFVMMYHGTLTELYGLDIAIRAFARVHQEIPQAELWILGSGTEQESLARVAQECGMTSKVRLVGRVPATEIPQWLNQCDAGILPIRRDVFLDFAFPNKLPEFIITGKPVLISRLKAIRHYFSEDSLAFFEPENEADLARQMVRLYQDPQLRARLPLKAAEEYRPICWEVMRQRYLNLVAELVGAPEESGKPARKPAPNRYVPLEDR